MTQSAKVRNQSRTELEIGDIRSFGDHIFIRISDKKAISIYSDGNNEIFIYNPLNEKWELVNYYWFMGEEFYGRI